LKLTKLNTGEYSSPLSSVEESQFRKLNNAHAVKLQISTCSTTTAKQELKYAAKSVIQSFKPTAVLKELLKQNTSVHTATGLYSIGKRFYTSLFTNAPTITALTGLML
jgi:hypothetical protein